MRYHFDKNNIKSIIDNYLGIKYEKDSDIKGIKENILHIIDKYKNNDNIGIAYMLEDDYNVGFAGNDKKILENYKGIIVYKNKKDYKEVK